MTDERAPLASDGGSPQAGEEGGAEPASALADAQPEKLGYEIQALYAMLGFFLGLVLVFVTAVMATAPKAPELPGGPDLDVLWANNKPLEGLPAAQVAANDSSQTVVVHRPLTPEVFPCTECHDPEDFEEDALEERELSIEHEGFTMNHGTLDWCFDCHHPVQRDDLRLAGGRRVALDDYMQLCRQCHGRVYREWENGIHGKRTGYWSGAKRDVACDVCHDPHHPEFKPVRPQPPPRPSYADPSQYKN